jgi:bisphosphoglycerate-dependent phosphoglycerate mutase
MKPIPISAAREIAHKYGYDQVMIYARKVDQPAGVGETAKQAIKGGERMTTFGVNKPNCDAMARIASFLQTKIMGWTKENEK